jgi:3-oxoacyl-[acyl-carrier protein] reductase
MGNLLKDKNSLITGSAQGIGKAIAKVFALEGSRIIVSDLNAEQGVQTASELKSLGVDSLFISCNVADSSQVQSMVEEIIAKWGKVDILVNNAGITKDALLLRMKDDDWNKVLTVNLNGVYNTTKALTKYMMKQNFGKIINVASVVGLMGNIGQSNYAASKAGVIGFTKTVAREFASRGITANCVAPGFIATDMTAKIPEEIQRRLKEQIPLARFGTPEEVANVCLFLASPLADYITGAVINIDGGMVMY